MFFLAWATLQPVPTTPGASGCYAQARLCCCCTAAALLWVLAHYTQEVGHDVLAILCDDALRVELHALYVRVPADSCVKGMKLFEAVQTLQHSLNLGTNEPHASGGAASPESKKGDGL